MSIERPKPAADPGPNFIVSTVPFPQAGSLWLVARDPFCVCAHWAFDLAALAAYAAQERGRWRLRVWEDGIGVRCVADQPLPETVTHRFVPVLSAATGYRAEVGFLTADGAWQGFAVSQPAATPPEYASSDKQVTLATVTAGPVTPESSRLSPPDSPAPSHGAVPAAHLLSLPDLDKAAQLFALVWREVQRGAPGNSAAVTTFVGEHVVLPGGAKLGPTAGGAELPVVGLPGSASVPPPASAAPRGFWFKVNAEVILYGSTERDAHVTIGGQPVKLRDDGSFSFRFALPDGEFPLPVVAVSAARDDGRVARVTFRRDTTLHGEVAVHPQDNALKRPTPAAVG